MPKINVLPKSVAELIAAGEVVERPSSVVKELVENSLDAGATAISVEIRGGGIRFIRVTDNGCGIAREDVRTAFISHATSKISSGDDLDSIFTLGFRGEALPSVAAVSRLSMLTKPHGEEMGTSFEIEGGEEKNLDDAGCPTGTTIIIKDLFYNTPARMKFLKKDVTEGSYVSDIVAKTAISHPDVRFSFIRDGKQVLSTPGNGDLKECLYAVFGKDVSEALIECEYEYKSVRVKGFISKPLNNRPNRNLQYCYVNGRFVRIPAAAAALDEAYKNRIMVGKFPMCFLFLDIPPGKIDVNVHPAKTEIRFSEDSSVFEAIYYGAKAALNKGDNERPGVVLKEKRNLLEKRAPEARQMSFPTAPSRAFSNTEEASPERKPTHTSASVSVVNDDSKESAAKKAPPASSFSEAVPTSGVFRDSKGVFGNMLSKEEAEKKGSQLLNEERKRVDELKSQTPEAVFASAFGRDVIPQKKDEVPAAENVDKTTEDDMPLPQEKPADEAALQQKNSDYQTEDVNEISFRIVGEIFKTYILVESAGKLLIIDKHAAHERMIFNSLRKNGFPEDSQMLMFPVAVTLSGKEYAAVTENLEVFRQGGFTVEDFSGGTVIVRDCPVALQKEDVAAIITEMAGELVKGNMRPVPEKLIWLYHSTACRAAIKAGDEMKEQETEALVKRLLSDSSIRYCPHGRPVMYELSKSEIEKQFGRI